MTLPRAGAATGRTGDLPGAKAQGGAGEANALCAASLFRALAAQGVRWVVASPGSRSTPLVLAAQACSELDLRIVTDERSAGFFAIGLARASSSPVAVVCTSGTAVANYMPSVAEADLSRAPVIYISADRPPEARDFGAAQTIRQPGLLGAHTRWSYELPVPEAGAAHVDHFAAVGARAVAISTAAHAGPVHLNAPFREPLLPSSTETASAESADACESPHPVKTPSVRSANPRLDWTDLEDLGAALAQEERGLIVCGPAAGGISRTGDSEALVALARELGWPMLADPLSGLRYGARGDDVLIVDAHDVLLRSEEFAARFAASSILRFGALPTSKPLQRYMASSGARHLLVASPGTWPDPDHLADDILIAETADAARALEAAVAAAHARGDSAARNAHDWAVAWGEASSTVRRAIENELDRDCEGEGQPDGAPVFEGILPREIVAALPDDGVCWVGNSMPVRDLDTFTGCMDKPLRAAANRGANGIDGVLSSALGACLATGAPTIAYVGDLSFLHDLGGLQIAARHRIPLLMIVPDNDGGGIFNYLPQSELGESFEELFATPHGLDVAAAGAAANLNRDTAGSRLELAKAIARWRENPVTQIIVVPTDREANVKRSREIVRVALSRLGELLEAAA